MQGTYFHDQDADYLENEVFHLQHIYKGKFSLQVMCTSLQMLPLKEPEKYETNKYFILSKFEQLIKAIFILLIYIKWPS